MSFQTATFLRLCSIAIFVAAGWHFFAAVAMLNLIFAILVEDLK